MSARTNFIAIAALAALAALAAVFSSAPVMAEPFAMTAKTSWGQNDLKPGAGRTRAEVAAEALAARGSPTGEGAAVIEQRAPASTSMQVVSAANGLRSGEITYGER